jgi:hypothetical protein
MKAPQEYRDWLTRMRSRFGRLSSGLLDNPEMERKLGTSKRANNRQAAERELVAEATQAWRRRGINRRATVDEFGDTHWPDSDFLFEPPELSRSR